MEVPKFTGKLRLRLRVRGTTIKGLRGISDSVSLVLERRANVDGDNELYIDKRGGRRRRRRRRKRRRMVNCNLPWLVECRWRLSRQRVNTGRQ